MIDGIYRYTDESGRVTDPFRVVEGFATSTYKRLLYTVLIRCNYRLSWENERDASLKIPKEFL